MPVPSVPPVRAPRGGTGRRRAALLIGAAALLVLASPPTAALASPAAPPTAAPLDLGAAVHVFTPDMPKAEVQAQLDAIAQRQLGNQFGTERDAVLFAPGTYGTAADPLVFQVGYYTEVAGLGASPKDVVINGAVNVQNQCDATSGCIALNNFWRSLSNLTINPLGGSGCSTNTEFWAVSQASPMRRVVVNGTTSFMDYCSAGPQYASGGFVADSVLAGTPVNGSQQQFYTRNSTIGGWSNGVWNQVFSGTEGAPATDFPSTNPYTTLATTPVSREKPFLYLDGRGKARVFVPSARTDSSGPSWTSGQQAGRSVALDRFFIATPKDSARTIDRELARGKDLLLTPGVYSIDRTLTVRRPNTVVLGLGVATLTSARGAVPLKVGDVAGVDIAGIMVDAGPKNAKAMLQVGTGRHVRGAASNPTALQDVFFRIGGPHAGRATTSLVVNSDHVLLDDIWAWRADHGEGVGWTKNTAATGVVVNGDHVTATGLFVEHFQRYNVIWNGEHGRTVFFQNELPYDAPDQAAWRHGRTFGWAAYKVADRVRTHELWGGGSYIYTNVDPTLHASRAFEVPQRPGVVLHDVLTVSLNKAGTIDHVVNDVGSAVTPDVQGPSTVVRYPAQ
ncbi:glycosyl hydrolase family 28-related protein [Amnibacterium setariae]|uniref:Adenylyl cyclase n=1 Tax=Amnibacterium setariae TaxID=2306585 RepID=A0A3A1TZ36_9MICO|nr:adenylyl cyclase [Amnibacterium setariae]RIX28858.1 adenylyl cyclase [Amnibacterium setariae]